MDLKAHWLEEHSYEESIEILTNLALSHAADSGPYCDILSGLLRNRDFGRLLDWKLDYVEGMDPLHLVHARQVKAFFEKLEPLKLPLEDSKTKIAFKSFVQSEMTCSLVNERFRNYTLGTPMGYPYDIILADARSQVHRILGVAPKLSELGFSFGPGGTTNVKKREASARSKLGAPLECSLELVPLLGKFLAEVPAYALAHAETTIEDDEKVVCSVPYVVRAGRLEFVPKNAKKYRSIIVEPGLNVLIQQGIGRYLKRVLKARGINLRDQTINQAWAKQGSCDDSIATIDFSAASDSIAKCLVNFLLPESWSILLSFARTRFVEYNGLELPPLEKFSSMGNSFTFELESVIFYSVAWSIRRFLKAQGPVSIFGDDLVLPSTCAHLAELVFAFCGFTINRDKSYWTGPFRESCGADFYKGFDIRPYYQKTLVTGETLFTLHNFYVRTGDLVRAKEVLKRIHPSLHRFGPNGYGDGHLIGSWHGEDKYIRPHRPASNQKVRVSELGWEGSYFKAFRRVPLYDKRRNFGDKILPTYCVYHKYLATPDEEVDNRLPSPTATPHKGDMWADPPHFVVPGSDCFEEISIYTNKQSVF